MPKVSNCQPRTGPQERSDRIQADPGQPIQEIVSRTNANRYSDEDLIRIQRDMTIIRTFENMLNEIKLRGNYMGIEYMHNGPAHLSIGQEAAAVGQAYHTGYRRPHLRQSSQSR